MRQKRRRRGASKAAGKRIGPQGIILFILYSLKRAKNTGLISSAQRSKRATIRQNRVSVARAGCPLWVKSRHRGASNQCPLYPQKRTSELNRGMCGRNDDIGFCAHDLLAEFRKTILTSLARVSCDDQINSLDVTKAAQLLEKCSERWIAPTFAHISDGGRGMNEGNAVRLRSLLRTRRERPGGCDSAEKLNDLPSSHAPSQQQTIPGLREVLLNFRQ